MFQEGLRPIICPLISAGSRISTLGQKLETINMNMRGHERVFASHGPVSTTERVKQRELKVLKRAVLIPFIPYTSALSTMTYPFVVAPPLYSNSVLITEPFDVHCVP